MDKADLEQQLQELEAKITISSVESLEQWSQLHKRHLEELTKEISIFYPHRPNQQLEHGLESLWIRLENYFSYRAIQGRFTQEYQKRIEVLLNYDLDQLSQFLTLDTSDSSADWINHQCHIKFTPNPALEQQVWEALRRKILQTGISSFQIKSHTNSFLDQVVSEFINLEFKDYYKSKGYSEANCNRGFSTDYFASAREIQKSYDVGVAIAKGGLYAAYVLNLAGLPIIDVEMKRKGSGATWKPHENFQGEKLTGKRVVILENDIVTGRTLRRVVRELQKYAPATMGVCFMESERNCKIKNLPPGISRVHHLITSSTDTISFECEYQLTLELAQRLDAKYNLFRKE